MNISSIVYIVLAVIFVLILIVFVEYNKLIKTQNVVKKAKANIEICLNKRFDLIPNIVECVKSYSGHESDTLEEIVSLRNNYKENKDINLEQAGMLNNRLNKYLAVVEAYPDLKANTQYMSLQNELRSIEDELSKARQIYNNDVTIYNTLIEKIPSNLIASIFSFKQAELFQVDSEKRENVKVEL